MVREREGPFQNQSSGEGPIEEHRLTKALVYIIAITTVTTLLKTLHYIMRHIFLAKLYTDNQELESSFQDLDLK